MVEDNNRGGIRFKNQVTTSIDSDRTIKISNTSNNTHNNRADDERDTRSSNSAIGGGAEELASPVAFARLDYPDTEHDLETGGGQAHFAESQVKFMVDGRRRRLSTIPEAELTDDGQQHQSFDIPESGSNASAKIGQNKNTRIGLLGFLISVGTLATTIVVILLATSDLRSVPQPQQLPLVPSPQQSSTPTLPSSTSLTSFPSISLRPSLVPTSSPKPTRVASLAPTIIANKEATTTPTSLAPNLTPSDSPSVAPLSLEPSMKPSPSEEPTAVTPMTSKPPVTPIIYPLSTIPSSPTTTATPTRTVSAPPALASTVPKSRVQLAKLDLEVLTVVDSGALNRAEIERLIRQFIQEHLKAAYDSSFASVETQTYIIPKKEGTGECYAVILTTRGTVLFDPNSEVATPGDVEISMAGYISAGGDEGLEKVLQRAGIREVNSISLGGELIPIPIAEPTPEPRGAEKRKQSQIGSARALAGIVLAGVNLCAVLALFAGRYCWAGERKGAETVPEDAEADATANEVENSGTFPDGTE